MDSGTNAEVNVEKDKQSLSFLEARTNDASSIREQSEVLSEEPTVGAKRTSFEEIQWSVFNVNSQQFGLGDFESTLIENTDEASYKESVGLIGMKTAKNLRSDRKNDAISGQCYQLDDYNATTNIASSNVCENSEAKVQNAMNLQQISARVFESISEESSLLKSRNHISRDNPNYPHNMVFDPQYPEWYYDTITQMWCTIESYNYALHDASNATEDPLTANEIALAKVQNAFDGSLSELTDAVNLQQPSHPILESTFEEKSVLNNRNQYPPNMVFDSQYPGWYYDTITQIWYTLESYNHACHDATNITQGQLATNVNDLDKVQNAFEGSVPKISYDVNLQQSSKPALETVSEESHIFNSKDQVPQGSIYYPPNMVFDPQYPGWYYDTISQMWYTLESYDHSLHDASNASQGSQSNNANTLAGLRIDDHSLLNDSHSQFGQYALLEQSTQKNDWNAFASGFEKQGQFSYAPNAVRSTAGRPPHALVTFGFGGKVIVMKDASSSISSFVSGSQGTIGGVVLIHGLVDVVMTKAGFFSSSTAGCFDYFHSLCQESFPGPLVGGNAASIDVNKWINDRIMSIEASSMDFQNGLHVRLLLSLLKILCQHYGRVRSPHGIETLHEGSDGPELEVSKLFASAKRYSAPFGGGSSMYCMKNPPSDGIRATATEVQNLLVSGKRKEALQCAQEGQLWGIAAVLAAQLGEQFYADTVKQMALRQFVCGSPLRTLYLLIAGQPADVFSSESSSNASSGVNGPYQCSEVQPNSLLDDWQENLAIIASNRTKDDELVIIHLGDCLWKERGQVTAAHACYLLAEVNFEPYSDSARLCLIGADHWKNTRTYACPDSIQRTEMYEYSKVIGNSQFVLLPFQPYKLVYAYMLAEVGKVSDSLRYCQASMKMLKNSGRSPDVELWRALFTSLEERLRTYQKSGYGTNFAPTKLVGKFFNSIDRSIHRMIGVPPLPPMLQNSGEGRDNNGLVQKVSSSQSAMAITSLMPSPSVETAAARPGDSSWKAGQNRSISEPDFDRSTKKNLSKDDGSYGQGNASISGGSSRFGRFGSQLLQKTLGWVSRSRHDRQAKLGESNKFYYDEKLKRWVEEGAELPAEEASLPPPPPIAASFQNDYSDHDVKNGLKSNSLTMDAKQETRLDAPSDQGFGLPPMPPTQNQFSARGIGGVRARYVDTFNKGGGSFTSSFRLPSAPSVNPLSRANLFIPTDHKGQTDDGNTHETTIIKETYISAVQESTSSPSSSMQKFPSMDNITSSQGSPARNDGCSRAASWSGDCPVGMEVASGAAPKFVPRNSTHTHYIGSSSSSSLDLDAGPVLDDLHEVEL